MKTNGKHTMNRKPMSSEEIKRMMDFDAVLKGASTGGEKGDGGKGGFKNGWYISGGALLILAGLAAWILIPLNKDNAISRQVEQNIPETMPRTQEDSEDLVRAPLVRLPVNEWDIAFSRYTLDATKGGIITHPSGTKIRVPGSCLIDQNGNKISGAVEFRYREFHDPIDIALSGIPMHYDSAGTNYYFETAGMSELRAFQGDQELVLEAGKKIQIDLHSQVDGPFNLYKLNEQTGWQPRGSNSPLTSRSDILEAERAVIGTDPVPPQQVPAKTVQEINYQKAEKELQKLMAEKPKSPEKATLSRPRFNLDVDLKDFPELEALGTMEFEVAPEDKAYTPEYKKIEWNDVQFKRYSDRRYKMILTRDAKGNTPKLQVELIVIPVIAEENYEAAKAKYEQMIREYDQKVAQKKKEAERLKKEAELAQKQAEIDRLKARERRNEGALAQQVYIRSFTMDGFGIWNCDNPRIKPDKIVTCRFEDEKGNALPILAVNCILPELKGLIVLHEKNGAYDVLIHEGKKEYVLLILEGKKLAFKKAEDVKPVDGVVVMVPVSRSFANAEEVREYLRSREELK